MCGDTGALLPARTPLYLYVNIASVVVVVVVPSSTSSSSVYRIPTPAVATSSRSSSNSDMKYTELATFKRPTTSSFDVVAVTVIAQKLSILI